MLYKTLQIEYMPFPNRLSRIIKVREDLDLFTLGVVLVVALNGKFQYPFVFQTRRRDYLSEYFNQLDYDTQVYMTNYHLKDLGNNFIFMYDTADSWIFKVKVTTTEEIRSRKHGFIIDAVGQGIWENELALLTRYLNGEIRGDIRQGQEEDKPTHLWERKVLPLSDFDRVLDIQSLDETFENRIIESLIYLEEKEVF